MCLQGESSNKISLIQKKWKQLFKNVMLVFCVKMPNQQFEFFYS